MHASLWAWPRLSASFSAAKIASGWRRLEAIASDRSRPLKHIQRANIVLHSAERLAVLEVARRAGVSRPAVWRWQLRYAEEGVDGLLRDKTRKPGRAPLSQKIIAKVLKWTCSEPPGAATHWTGRAMAKAAGISLRAVQRLWQKHGLQPHRLRSFKRLNDPQSPKKSRTPSASTWTRRPTPWSSPWTRKAMCGWPRHAREISMGRQVACGHVSGLFGAARMAAGPYGCPRVGASSNSRVRGPSFLQAYPTLGAADYPICFSLLQATMDRVT